MFHAESPSVLMPGHETVSRKHAQARKAQDTEANRWIIAFGWIWSIWSGEPTGLLHFPARLGFSSWNSSQRTEVARNIWKAVKPFLDQNFKVLDSWFYWIRLKMSWQGPPYHGFVVKSIWGWWRTRCCLKLQVNSSIWFGKWMENARIQILRCDIPLNMTLHADMMQRRILTHTHI